MIAAMLHMYALTHMQVERVCRDSTVYNPEQVKKFLMDAKLPDPRYAYVCMFSLCTYVRTYVD